MLCAQVRHRLVPGSWNSYDVPLTPPQLPAPWLTTSQVWNFEATLVAFTADGVLMYRPQPDTLAEVSLVVDAEAGAAARPMLATVAAASRAADARCMTGCPFTRWEGHVHARTGAVTGPGRLTGRLTGRLLLSRTGKGRSRCEGPGQPGG